MRARENKILETWKCYKIESKKLKLIAGIKTQIRHIKTKAILRMKHKESKG